MRSRVLSYWAGAVLCPVFTASMQAQPLYRHWFLSQTDTNPTPQVAALPLSQWNFKTDVNTMHIGPTAPNFCAAFGVGSDNKHIATVDQIGVAPAAIQGLNQKLERENSELRKELQEIKQLLSNLTKKGINQ